MVLKSFLDAVGSTTLLTDRLGIGDALLKQDAQQQLVMMAAQSYLMVFSQDAATPQFVSCCNHVFNIGGPNPDFMYYYCAMDGAGTYRLTGFRGNAMFVHVTQNVDFMGMADQPGPVVGNLNLDDLKLASDGYFSVLISATKPADYTGDWWQLDPRCNCLSVRAAAVDWAGVVDARMAIERLDKRPGGVRPTAQEIERRMQEAAKYADRVLKTTEGLLGMFRKIPVNTVNLSTFASAGGLANQSYYTGPWEIAPDEALILESDVPPDARYWATNLLDDLFSVLDWVNNQSSLNNAQAKKDSDGRYRAVVSLQDPGVPNWLDTVGHTSGIMQGRWLGAVNPPNPTLKRVKFAEVRKHLPIDTPTVTPDQRDEALRLRRRGAQFRRNW